jgi:hypothetical protein
MMVGVIWITFSDPPLGVASNNNKPLFASLPSVRKKKKTLCKPVFSFLFRPPAAIAAVIYCCLVGVRGFEPPASSSRTTRATGLRYTPNM